MRHDYEISGAQLNIIVGANDLSVFSLKLHVNNLIFFNQFGPSVLKKKHHSVFFFVSNAIQSPFYLSSFQQAKKETE
jgi:hypothetical protein